MSPTSYRTAPPRVKVSHFKSEIFKFEIPNLVGLGRFELPTSRLSGVRSNQLSYRPSLFLRAILPQKRATLLSECGPFYGGRAGGPCSFGGY